MGNRSVALHRPFTNTLCPRGTGDRFYGETSRPRAIFLRDFHDNYLWRQRIRHRALELIRASLRELLCALPGNGTADARP
ncbi:hypothetical protein F2P79_018734 [Pimephales promelas]|nr:hypothetical protein F2P79_018734 [Pimephales promelas]